MTVKQEHVTEAEKGDGSYIWTGSKFEIKRDANWKNAIYYTHR